MTGYFKTGSILFAIGFGLALFLGIVSGNQFGTVLLRSMLSGSITGMIGLGGHSLLLRFLPELFNGEDHTEQTGANDLSEMEEQQNTDTGKNVNILVEDDPFDTESDDDQGRQNPRHQASGLEEMVEEVAEDSDSIASVSREISDDTGFSEDAFYSGVESLPDIAGFEDSFDKNIGIEEADGGDDSDDSGYSPRENSSGQSRGGSDRGDMDPALLAKAIQTALKKEK